MNRQRAYDILQLNTATTLPCAAIKKQYHKLALLYHPDKSTGNEAKFKEINEAYQYLTTTATATATTATALPSYVVILENFINQMYENNPTPARKFAKEIVALYSNYCNHKDDLDWSLADKINNLDDDILMPLFEFICRYKHLLYIAADFVDKMEKYINNRGVELVYRFTPSLTDLFNCKVYKLNIDDATYFIPLWQPINYFDVAVDPTKEIMAICEPILDTTTQQIDEDNNLHIQLHISFDHLREYFTTGCGNNGKYIYSIDNSGGEDNITFEINLCELHLTTQMQVIRFIGRGIPRFDIVDNVNKENRGDVVFYIYLY